MAVILAVKMMVHNGHHLGRIEMNYTRAEMPGFLVSLSRRARCITRSYAIRLFKEGFTCFETTRVEVDVLPT